MIIAHREGNEGTAGDVCCAGEILNAIWQKAEP